MIYIFEGADLVGKTTKAKELAHEQGMLIIKKRLELLFEDREHLKQDMVERVTQFFFESIYPMGTRFDFILDRGLLSSLVYSKFFHREYNIDYVGKYLLEPELNRHIKIFLLHVNEETIRERIKKRQEKYFNVDEILMIQNMYLQFADVLIEKGAPIIKVENS